AQQYHEWRELRIALFLGRLANSIDDDIAAEVLFHDRSVVVAGLQNKWASRHRPKIDLAELADEPWSIPPPDTLVGSLIANAFRASGIKFPPRGVAFGTTRLHYALIASGPFVSIIPSSLLRFDTNLPPLKVLPVDLPDAFPVGIMTLKNRTLTPLAQLFIECARQVTKSLARPV